MSEIEISYVGSARHLTHCRYMVGLFWGNNSMPTLEDWLHEAENIKKTIESKGSTWFSWSNEMISNRIIAVMKTIIEIKKDIIKRDHCG